MRRPWEPERDVDEALAHALIRAHAPELAATRIERLGAGWDNIVYRVDERWVFRFPRRQLGADLIEREIAVLPRIADRLPLPVPKPLWIGQPTHDYPWPFAGYAYLAGRPACRAGLTEEQRCAMAEPLGRFVAALRAFPTDDLEGLGGDDLGKVNVDRRDPVAREKLASLAGRGLIASPDPWLALLEDLPRGPRPTRCLSHGDLYSLHLMVDDAGRLTGVIDWGDVHLGDPACDLMILYTFMPPRARPAFEAVHGPLDEPTRRLARLRGLYHSATIAEYGDELGDAALRHEGLLALDYLVRGA